MSQTDKMLSHKEGKVGYLTFNNPERHNAVSLEMWEAASGFLEDFKNDKNIRVVVVTGAWTVVVFSSTTAFGVHTTLSVSAFNANTSASSCSAPAPTSRPTGSRRHYAGSTARAKMPAECSTSSWVRSPKENWLMK